MFDLTEFLLGLVGAVVVVYLSRTIEIPEFRSFFDTAGQISDRDAAAERLKDAYERIRAIEAELQEAAGTPQRHEALQSALEALQRDVERDCNEKRAAERVIRSGQIASRTLGILAYIGLGGVFGDLFAGEVDIEGVGGNLQALVIGSAWASYLATLAPLAEKLALPRLGGAP